MFRDNYTNFTFDDLRSENFKVWITNKNDLKRNMSPNFSDKFNAPTYGQVRYHEGTTIDKQDFKFSCVAVDVTLNEWRAITEWLSPLKSGKLTLDWNDKYYYMVKLSKAPSGTMFMKSKIDNVMGQLFIITFDLEFTTVYDWAALGPYCEQRMCSANEEGELTYSEIDPSIYNNPYFIPQIIRCKSFQNKQKTIPVSTRIYASMSDKVTLRTTGTGTIYITNSRFDRLYKVTRGYNDKAQLIYSFFVVDSKVPTLDATFTTTEGTIEVLLPSKNCYLESENGNWVANFDRENNFAFCNPGSYDAYPMMYTPDRLVLKENGQLKFKYETNGEQSISDVVINNRQFTFTYGGRSIESVRDFSGKEVFSNIEIKSPLVINSGRPELIKAIFVEDIQKDNSTDDKYLHIRRARFLLNGPLIYDRYRPFIIHAFNNDFTTVSNIFNIDKYSDKLYTGLTFKNLVLVDPIIHTQKTWR